MAKQNDLKLVRISRSVGRKLVFHLVAHNKLNPLAKIDAGRFIDAAILEKISRGMNGK